VAKQDDVIALAQFALGLRPLAQADSVVAMIASRSDGTLKERLQRLIAQKPQSFHLPLPPALEARQPGSLDTLYLNASTRAVVERFLADYALLDAFAAHGVPVAHKLLLTGEPGNGKTSLAAALAGALAVPLFALDLSKVFDSYLGSTSKSLGESLRFAATQPCVLCLDEVDVILSERSAVQGDATHGEISRVVASLLIQLERLPPHVVLVAATNHPEMLDRAARRRFDVVLELPPPDAAGVAAWCATFARRVPSLPFVAQFAAEPPPDGVPMSYAELERQAWQWCRAWIASPSPAKRVG